MDNLWIPINYVIMVVHPCFKVHSESSVLSHELVSIALYIENFMSSATMKSLANENKIHFFYYSLEKNLSQKNPKKSMFLVTRCKISGATLDKSVNENFPAHGFWIFLTARTKKHNN